MCGGRSNKLYEIVSFTTSVVEYRSISHDTDKTTIKKTESNASYQYIRVLKKPNRKLSACVLKCNIKRRKKGIIPPVFENPVVFNQVKRVHRNKPILIGGKLYLEVVRKRNV